MALVRVRVMLLILLSTLSMLSMLLYRMSSSRDEMQGSRLVISTDAVVHALLLLLLRRRG